MKIYSEGDPLLAIYLEYPAKFMGKKETQKKNVSFLKFLNE